MVSVKSAAVNARSRVTGVKNRPRLCRRPMPMLSSTAEPSRISWVETCATFEAICKGDQDDGRGRASLPDQWRLPTAIDAGNACKLGMEDRTCQMTPL